MKNKKPETVTLTVSSQVTANLAPDVRRVLATLAAMNGAEASGPSAEAVNSMLISAAVLLLAESDADQQQRALLRVNASRFVASDIVTPEQRTRAALILEICGAIPTPEQVFAYYRATDGHEIERVTAEVNDRLAA